MVDPLTIRRVISEDEWTNDITPRVDGGAEVTVYRQPGGVAFIVQRAGDAPQIRNTTTDDGCSPLTAKVLVGLEAGFSLRPSHLGQDPTFNPVRTKGAGLAVTEFADERLSVVHHTESEGAEKNAHLTVENARVLAFEELLGSSSRDARSKAELTKPDINDALTGTYGVGSVDNLDFYGPAKGEKKGRRG